MVEKPVRPSRHLAWPAALILCFALTPIPAQSQGCTQCLDTTASTSPATQRAYRRAIVLMASAAATLFLTTLVIMKRNP